VKMPKVRVFSVRVRRAGNSYIITIPREVAEKLGLQEGDWVVVSIGKLRNIVEGVRP